MKSRRTRKASLSKLAAIQIGLLIGSAPMALAQQEEDPFAGVEEMIVTGSGFVGQLTDSSVSVTAFDAGELEALGVGDVSDVAAFTPNLEIRTASSTTPTFFVRGVGLNSFTANAASAVAVYVDDAPRNLPAIQLGLLYDLEGITVLKGPQGSGPGRNASAGAIRISTKKPTGEYNAYGRIDYGNFNLIDVEGALEAPIVEDMLAIRSAFRLKQRDGIMKNRCGGLSAEQILPGVSVCNEQPRTLNQPAKIRPGLEKYLNNTDSWSTRTSLRFLPPVDDMEWTFTAHVDRIDQLATVGQHLGATTSLGSADRGNYQAPEVGQERQAIIDSLDIPSNRDCRVSPDPAACRALQQQLRDRIDPLLGESLASRPLDKLPFEGDYNTDGFERQTSWGVQLNGDWIVSGMDLKSITGFERYDRERLIDADYSSNTFFEFDIVDDAWQFTQDLRLEGELDVTPLSWSAGVFFLQEELDYSQETLSDGGPVEPLFQSFFQETSSFGAFADLSWDFLDDFTFEAGVRYNWEQKLFEAEIFTGSARSNQCRPNADTGVIPPCKRIVTVDHPTGMVGLKYHYDELRTVYFKYSHGWKGAQFNARSGVVAGQVTDVADPEIIDAFELGINGSWLEEMIRVNGALFWYAYQNYQVFTFTNDTGVPPVQVVINANDAQLYGAELEVTLEPVEALVFDIRASWLESKFLDFTDSVSRPIPGSVNQRFRQVFDYNGNRLPNAPRFKVSGSAQYRLELGRIGSVTPRYDFVWTDEVFFDPSGGRGAPNLSGEIFMPDGTIGQEAFILHNVRLTYIPPSGNLEITGWARNLTNEVYKTLAFDASGGPGFVGNLVGDPRTYGLSVKLSY